MRAFCNCEGSPTQKSELRPRRLETPTEDGASSEPRETRTPTEDSLHKALNLASGALVVSEGVQIVRSKAKSWTGWTIRNDADVATVHASSASRSHRENISNR